MFFWIVKIVLYPFLLIYFKPKIYGRENRKSKGRIIVMANHKSLWDPVLLDMFFPRQLIYIAKAELFKNKLFGFILQKLGAFKVNRGAGDIGAVKKALKVLNEEKVLGIFPEGKRNKELSGFESGVVMLALKTNTNIIPAYIGGKYSLFSRVKLAFGEQIDLKEITKGQKPTTELTNKCLRHLTDELIKLKEMCEH